MRKLKLQDEKGKILSELEVPESFCVVYGTDGATECWAENLRYMKYNDKFVIHQEYQLIAQRLVDAYSDRLVYVEPRRIAFAVDEAWELKENTTPNSRIKVDIKRASKLFALGDAFYYIIHFKGYYLERWSEAQINAAIMSQLIRINNSDGCIMRLQDDAANPLVATFGVGYLEPNTVIPDLLKERIHIKEFRRADGQMSMDELGEDEEASEDDAD